MPSPDLLPTQVDSDNALRLLLNRAISYENAGAVIPLDLLRFGFLGSIIVIATGIIALILPGADAVRHSDFFLVLGGLAANVTTLMKALALPAILFGTCLLGVDIYLMKVRTPESSRFIVIAQAAMGGAGGAICTTFLALLVLNFFIWIVIAILCMSMFFMAIIALSNT
jgi:hypothetical protein